MEEHNPFAAPEADPTPEVSANDEEVRLAHLDHEAAVRGIGALWIVAAVFNGLLAFSMLAALGEIGGIAASSLTLAFIFFTALFGWTGVGLRRLERSARVPSMIMAGFGLLSFPIGTMLGTYVLYRLGSDEGSFVLSPEYQAIRRRTPHLRHRTSRALLLALLALLGLALMIALAFADWP